MSRAASLPPWEVTPSWGEKRVPVPPVPVVPKVRFAHLENTFIPPIPPPPPEPVSAPPPQPQSNAHRRALSLPKNPRPVRPKVPTSPRPIDPAPQPTTNASPISVADPLPPPIPESTQNIRPRSRSSTLPGTAATSPSASPNSSRPPLPVNNANPSSPSSDKSLTSPQKQVTNIRENNDAPVTKLLPPPPPPQSDIQQPNTAYATPRTSRFNVLKRSLSLKILPQNSNGRRSPSALSATPKSPTPPTPDLPSNWSNTIGPSRSLTSRKKYSKRLASPSYNEEIFAWIRTEGGNEKEASDYTAQSPSTPRASALPSPGAAMRSSKALHVRQRSRRLASPGYVQEKYSSIQAGGSRDRDTSGDVVVSGGRSPGIRDEDAKTNDKPMADGMEGQIDPGRPGSSTFDILDMYDEMDPSSPKPEPPPKESAGPRLIPLKYASAASPKEAGPPTIPALPKLIPLKFLSPPSPSESEDESFAYSFEPIDDATPEAETPIKVAPLRIKSSQNTLTVQSPNTASGSTLRAPSSLTAHLISSATPRKLYNATHSTFLRSCSNGKISAPLLSRYLTQERIFLQSYLRFLALLLANISVAPKPTQPSTPMVTTDKKEKDLNMCLTTYLIKQLTHTQSLLSLFADLATSTPLDLSTWEESENQDGMTDATRMLVRLIDVIGSAIERSEKSVLVGLVVCWIHEKALLEAWGEVHSTAPTEHENEASRIVTEDLLPAWVGKESLAPKEELTGLLDEIWEDRWLNEGMESVFEERGNAMGRGGEGDWEKEAKGCEEMVEIVLGILGRWWPEA